MDAQKLKALAKAVLKSVLKKLALKAAKAIITKVLAVVSPWILLVVLLALLISIFMDLPFSFGSDDKDSSTKSEDIAFFTTGVEGDDEWNLSLDKDLYNDYIELVEHGIDDMNEKDLSFGSQEVIPYQLSQYKQATGYRLSWALLAATDRVFGDPTLTDKIHRKPDPEQTYRHIGPRFEWQDSVTTVVEKTPIEGGGTSVVTKNYDSPMLKLVTEYRYKVKITYKRVTETFKKGKTEITVTKDVVNTSETIPTPNKLLDLIYSKSLTSSDEEFIVELTKAYDPTFMDYSLGGDYLVDNGYIGLDIPQEYIPIYKAAAKKYGISWYYLASIHYQETRFSKDSTMLSSKGAIGHMQFLPATWAGWDYSEYGENGKKNGLVNSSIDITNLKIIKAGGGYGVDANGDGKADPWNIDDAIYSAANYLSKNGLNKNPRKAILAYNKSSSYAEEVLSRVALYKSNDNVTLPTPDFSGKNSNSPFVNPLGNASYRISSPYGMRYHPITNVYKFHEGLDMAAPQGTPIYAVKDGIVIVSGWVNGYGNTVIIDHGDGLTTLYGHIVDGGLKVRKGQQIKQGQNIASIGSTGNSTGPHLHFQVEINNKTVDPQPYIK